MRSTVPVAPFLWTKNHRALQAAARLGDEEADEELRDMNRNLMWAVIAVVLVAGIVAISFFSLSYVDTRRRVEGQERVEEIRRDQALRLDAEKERAQLRLKYVSGCKVTPEEAEQLFPRK